MLDRVHSGVALKDHQYPWEAGQQGLELGEQLYPDKAPGGSGLWTGVEGLHEIIVKDTPWVFTAIVD